MSLRVLSRGFAAAVVAGAVVVVLAIALGAVSLQALRAAHTDPAETLRYE